MAQGNADCAVAWQRLQRVEPVTYWSCAVDAAGRRPAALDLVFEQVQHRQSQLSSRKCSPTTQTRTPCWVIISSACVLFQEVLVDLREAQAQVESYASVITHLLEDSDASSEALKLRTDISSMQEKLTSLKSECDAHLRQTEFERGVTQRGSFPFSEGSSVDGNDTKSQTADERSLLWLPVSSMLDNIVSRKLLR